ncbi:MAG: dicarboxylate/amino acid:cation symporter [Succinivibrio sp.]|nr:dicarboxylate/amino acid:cation symporter [Succinivibrio sp.]
MSDNTNRIDEKAAEVLNQIPKKNRVRTAFFYMSALLVGAILGLIGNAELIGVMNFIATIFTRLFSFIAMPVIALSLLTTVAKIGNNTQSGRIFIHTIFYTLLTTIIAASLAALLYVIIKPENVPVAQLEGAETPDFGATTYLNHILSVVPNNLVEPFVKGNVLSILIIAIMFGLALAHMPQSAARKTLMNFFSGLQEIFFMIIHAILAILPLGIIAFTAQLVADLEAGVIIGGISSYFVTVLSANFLQMLVVLPLLLLIRGLNPLQIARGMAPALMVAFFSKSSAGTLPVTIASAEDNLHVDTRISRFVLPICTTINMNGCAAFIFLTSIYLMQNAGANLTVSFLLIWIGIATLSAIGNAGVPMGCFFLTLSLMSSMNVPVQLMGIILPVYAVIDMIETGLNVWSDSCVCNIVNKELKDKLDDTI